MNRHYILVFKFIVLIFFSNSLYAQKELRVANKHFENFEYQLAIPLYKIALDMDSSLEALEKLAFCLKSTNQNKEAIKYYRIALDIPYYNSTSVMYFGETLLKTGNYDEAQEQFELYLNYEPANKDYIIACINSCKFARLNKNINVDLKINNIKEINTKFSESSIYITDKNLYISSNKRQGSNVIFDGWTGASFYKIYSLPYKINSNKISYQRLKLFEQNINGKFHAMYPSFNQTENKLFFSFTSLEENPKKKYKVRPKEFINRISIAEGEKSGRKWNIRPIIKNPDSIGYSILHPCLSKDGKRLYFASDKPGGYGAFDLYYCEVDSGMYSDPINLGPNINTAGQELFPTMSEDSILYFSSNGHPGYGGLDIFKTFTREFASPINMGLPINSCSDDFSLVHITGKKLGFLCSDREGGKGFDDVYQIEWK